MQLYRTQMAQITANSREIVDLNINVPTASVRDILIRYWVLILRFKPINKCTGPYIVLDVNGKVISAHVSGRVTQSSIYKVN